MRTRVAAGRFDDARALLDEQAKEPTLDERSRTMIERMRGMVGFSERMTAATTAARAGKLDEAQAIFTSLANDATLEERARREAQRALDQLAQRRSAR